MKLIHVFSTAGTSRILPALGLAVGVFVGQAAAEAESADTPEIFVEAELPEGFPTPGPAGEVVLKTYPAYRAARAEGRNAFGQLFRHISRHDIAMTAPVEMTLEEPDPAEEKPPRRVRELDMAFLYADPELGDAGPDGTVEVIDLPARQALSYGFFGNATPEVVSDAIDRLHAGLDQYPDLTADGPPRLLGYNSPFVPPARRFHEVQLPVAKPAPPDETPETNPEADAAPSPKKTEEPTD